MTMENNQNTTQQQSTQQGAPTQPEGNGGSTEKMFTQEDVNRIVRDRLARERAKTADVETQEADFAKREADLAKREADFEEREAAVKALELQVLKKHAAMQLGLPEEVADRLRGSDETEILEDAKGLLKAMGKVPVGYPNVRDGGEPAHVPTISASGFERGRKHEPKPFIDYQTRFGGMYKL